MRVPSTVTFAACLLLAGITSGAALAVPDDLLGPRLLLALAFALFAPGYLLVCSLFPAEDDMGHLLRFCLSLACSFALIILLTLALSITPVERSAPAQLLAMDGLILVLVVLAVWRQRRMPRAAQLAYVLSVGSGSLHRDPFVLIALALTLVVAAATIHAAVGANSNLATALSIPTGGDMANPVQPDSLMVDVQSHEAATVTFQVVVTWQDQTLGRSAPFALQPGQSIEEHVATTPPPGQGPVPVNVMLFAQGHAAPFRQLRIWMRTIPYRPPA